MFEQIYIILSKKTDYMSFKMKPSQHIFCLSQTFLLSLTTRIIKKKYDTEQIVKIFKLIQSRTNRSFNSVF